MVNFKELTVWIIILNFFIMIGAGHGIAPIGLFEIGGILKVILIYFLLLIFESRNSFCR